MSRNQGNVGKFPFFLLGVVKTKLIRWISGVTTESICIEQDRIVVVDKKRVSSIIHEKNILLERNVEAWVMKGREAKRLCQWNVIVQLFNKRIHVLVLDHQLYISNVAYVVRSRVISQEI